MKRKIKNRIVIYTCITEGYDSLKEVKCKEDGVDYVCFTDAANQKSKTWQIRPLPAQCNGLDKARQNRWVKLHSHILFPEHSHSIYIDGSLEIIGKLFDYFKAEMNKYDMIVPAHPCRNCIYDEAEYVLFRNKGNGVDLQRQMNSYRQAGMPELQGLMQAGVLFRRHTKATADIMQQWWAQIIEFVPRDQLSLPFVLNQNPNFKYKMIHPDIISSNVLEFYYHGNEMKMTVDYNLRNSNLIMQEIRMSIGLVYGGRMPELMPYWLEKLLQDVEILRYKPELIIINNSKERISWITDYHLQFFSNIKIITGRQPEKLPDGRISGLEVCTLLADCCNMILQQSTGNMIHLREDDMIPKNNCFLELYKFLSTASADVGGVGAFYLNRHLDKIVGGHYDVRNPRESKKLEMGNIKSNKPIQVDFTGTGCLLFWRDKSPDTFHPQVDNVNCHDWRFCLDMKKMGYKMYVIPTAICRHYISCEFKFAEPDVNLDLLCPELSYSQKSKM